MAETSAQPGRSPLRVALDRSRSGLMGVAAVSAALNLLVLGGSIYMMLVYDRVLPSQSIATLAGLFALVTLVFVFHGMFEVMRSHMLSDVSADLEQALGPTVADLSHRLAIHRPDDARTNSPQRDLDQIRSFIAGPGPGALIDLPWIILFLTVLTLLHVWLGLTALVGALVLASITWMTDRSGRDAVGVIGSLSIERHRLADRQRRHAEVIQSLGMRGRMTDIFAAASQRLTEAQRQLTERTATLGGAGKVFRMFLQSLVLTVGALLVLSGQATGGIIFASSILAGRALAPVDQAIGQWRNFIAARTSWARLNMMLINAPMPEPKLELPPPARDLVVEGLSLAPPGSQRLAISGVSFSAVAGQSIGIIGPSASGKSSLVRGIVGAWPASEGTIRIDGATLDQWDSDRLGRHIGYLPQSVELFSGTVAQNIARFDTESTAEAIIRAAQIAGVHDLILALPDGYESQVGEDGMHLSAGQRQRIGLARALYNEPFLVVLDEPNSNLDPAGEAALSNAIVSLRKRGAISLVVAHRHSVLQTATHVLLLQEGKVRDFGVRDDVLAKLTRPVGAPTTTAGSAAAAAPAGRSTPVTPTNLSVVSGNG